MSQNLYNLVTKLTRTFRRYYWKFFGYPYQPPRDFKIKKWTNSYTGNQYSPRYNKLAALYLAGMEIKTIAEYHNLTRERVRQCVWKAYRNYENENI